MEEVITEENSPQVKSKPYQSVACGVLLLSCVAAPPALSNDPESCRDRALIKVCLVLLSWLLKRKDQKKISFCHVVRKLDCM